MSRKRKRQNRRDGEDLRNAAVGGAVSGFFRSVIDWVLDQLSW
ncbi:hypothetical protein PV410_43105 [Streptomyces sp. PA03-5A]|nr:hypothetical protein [Streptomyces sp. PA03-5A]